jgi:hypothetical protein
LGVVEVDDSPSESEHHPASHPGIGLHIECGVEIVSLDELEEATQLLKGRARFPDRHAPMKERDE